MRYVVTVHLTNETTGSRFSDWQEVTDSRKGEIFRQAQAEYGRCTGKVYVDTAKGTKAVGWFFLSRQEYEDAQWGTFWHKPGWSGCRTKTQHQEHCTYLRGAWITIRRARKDDSEAKAT